MALPDKKIKKIKLPGDVEGSQTYEIIPERLQKNGYEAVLPNLTKNSTIALTDDLPSAAVEIEASQAELEGLFAVFADQALYASSTLASAPASITSDYIKIYVTVDNEKMYVATLGKYDLMSTDPSQMNVYCATYSSVDGNGNTDEITFYYEAVSKSFNLIRSKNDNMIVLSGTSGSIDNIATVLAMSLRGGVKHDSEFMNLASATVTTLTFESPALENDNGTLKKGRLTVTLGASSATWAYEKTNVASIPTKTSDLTNDSDFITSNDLPTNHVTTDTAQTITGNKTFIGQTLRAKATESTSNYFYVKPDGNGYNAKIGFQSDNLMLSNSYVYSMKHFIPSGSSLDLGISANKWRDLYLSGSLKDGTNSITVADIVGKADHNQTIKGNGTAFGADAVVNFEGSGIVSVTGDATNDKITISASHQSIKTLDTTATTAQSTNANEAIAGSGKITLHKIAKTGNYNDLLNKPNVSESLVEKTYSELKTLRDNSQLVPGTWYRITDYVTTTSQSNTSSAGHQFDIIVKANGANKLDENAYAVQHTGDTYFANSNLSAWKLNYCIDNDTNRFTWAGSSNGKGVVYRMIDEFNNDCPYDFKNILFTVSGKYTNAYTFSYTEDSVIKDASLLGISKLCYNNVIRAYINISTSKQPLNSNVFYSTDTSFGCYSNTLGYNCYLDTFGNGCANNVFGDGCYSNTFGNSCANNTFGDGCYSNTFGNSFIHNAFNDNCYSNTFGSNCSNNIFGYSYHHNVSVDYFWYNVFDNNCAYNSFGRFCVSNVFGNECRYVTFGNSSSTIGYCRDIVMDSGCQYLYVNSTDTSATASNYLQNIHIHLGVLGTSSSRKTITISDRNLPYETNVYMNANGNVYTIINEGEGGGSYETATEEEIRALFSTKVQDSQGNIITDANDQIIAVS